jgi:uncharacterized protein (TIGR02996 family)
VTVRAADVGAQLAAAARAAPDDGVAWQLYADWLEEQGDWRGTALALELRLRGGLAVRATFDGPSGAEAFGALCAHPAGRLLAKAFFNQLGPEGVRWGRLPCSRSSPRSRSRTVPPAPRVSARSRPPPRSRSRRGCSTWR